MKPFLYGILSGLMCLGLWALVDATMKEREAKAAEAQHEEHCAQINTLIITEFDEIVARGKFPSDAQQDRWRQMSAECQEER